MSSSTRTKTIDECIAIVREFREPYARGNNGERLQAAALQRVITRLETFKVEA